MAATLLPSNKNFQAMQVGESDFRNAPVSFELCKLEVLLTQKSFLSKKKKKKKPETNKQQTKRHTIQVI